MLNWAGMLPFIFITSFTPGPNNVASASMGMLYGYRKSLPFLLGIVCGFFVLMLLSGLLSQTLMDVLPSFETILRIVGAIYIGWLAYETLRSSYDFELKEQPTLTYWRGFFMQMLNVKAIFYGLRCTVVSSARSANTWMDCSYQQCAWLESPFAR